MRCADIAIGSWFVFKQIFHEIKSKEVNFIFFEDEITDEAMQVPTSWVVALW